MRVDFYTKRRLGGANSAVQCSAVHWVRLLWDCCTGLLWIVYVFWLDRRCQPGALRAQLNYCRVIKWYFITNIFIDYSYWSKYVLSFGDQLAYLIRSYKVFILFHCTNFCIIYSNWKIFTDQYFPYLCLWPRCTRGSCRTWRSCCAAWEWGCGPRAAAGCGRASRTGGSGSPWRCSGSGGMGWRGSDLVHRRNGNMSLWMLIVMNVVSEPICITLKWISILFWAEIFLCLPHSGPFFKLCPF